MIPVYAVGQGFPVDWIVERLPYMTDRVCPFCGKVSYGPLPADCTRCEATDGPGTGTPLIEYEGIPWRYYQPAIKPEGIR